MKYDERVKALREHSDLIETSGIELYGPSATRLLVYDLRNAAAAIEALEAANKELSEELLEAQAEKPHWISAELPPKENGAYVVWWNYKGTSYWFRCIFFDGRWLFEHGTPKPDYWMPIEPPQEVQE